MSPPSPLAPYFSYVDAKAAIAFLETAFGLTRGIAFDGPNGRLVHGEMWHGSAAILIGSVDAPVPRQSPGVYLVVADVDSHYARAIAAGADIVYRPEDTEFGTRRYRARDIEGHEWSFGTYSPTPPSAP